MSSLKLRVKYVIMYLVAEFGGMNVTSTDTIKARASTATSADR